MVSPKNVRLSRCECNALVLRSLTSDSLCLVMVNGVQVEEVFLKEKVMPWLMSCMVFDEEAMGL